MLPVPNQSVPKNPPVDYERSNRPLNRFEDLTFDLVPLILKGPYFILILFAFGRNLGCMCSSFAALITNGFTAILTIGAIMPVGSTSFCHILVLSRPIAPEGRKPLAECRTKVRERYLEFCRGRNPVASLESLLVESIAHLWKVGNTDGYA